MSNNINTTIIQNPQATVNTSVQASVLNGGNLAQSFNLQALRIVKGIVSLTADETGYVSVINEYDGSPVTLGPSDFVIGFAVSNGNPNNSNTGVDVPAANNLPYTPLELTPSTAALKFSLNSNPPTFNVVTQQWTPNASAGTDITPVLTAGDVNGIGAHINPGYGLLSSSLSTTCGANSWLQADVSVAFTTAAPAVSAGAVNITLLVMTGFPSQ